MTRSSTANLFDNTQAYAEGWAIFDDGDIQRLDEGPVSNEAPMGTGTPAFSSDKEAVLFISEKANSGSEYHRTALAMNLAMLMTTDH